MSDVDAPWRIALLACLLVHMATRARAHLRAGTTKREGFLAAREGWLISVILGALIAAHVGSLALWLAHPPALDFARVELPVVARASGYAVIVAGLLLSAWVHATLGRFFNPTIRLREDHELIDHGPYARVRHPMYSAIALLVIGDSLVAQNALVFGAGGTMLFWLIVVRTPIEERVLAERFGDRWTRYVARTGRVLPALGRTA
jgi:protein-S-isoprenylcysteine O-methyltransferase Ste14